MRGGDTQGEREEKESKEKGKREKLDAFLLKGAL